MALAALEVEALSSEPGGGGEQQDAKMPDLMLKLMAIGHPTAF